MTTRRRRKQEQYREQVKQERARRPTLVARTDKQREYIRAIRHNEITLVHGPAGTGKTHVAIGMALQLLQSGELDRLILSRPMVCVGKDIGYLPGDVMAKVGPYVTPCFDELRYYLPIGEINQMLKAGVIDIVPLPLLRGRTFNRAFVLLDEAQNTLHVELKTVLTRIGEDSRFVIAGDFEQSDLRLGDRGAFEDAVERIQDRIEGIAVVGMDREDIVRNKLIPRLLEVLW